MNRLSLHRIYVIERHFYSSLVVSHQNRFSWCRYLRFILEVREKSIIGDV